MEMESVEWCVSCGGGHVGLTSYGNLQTLVDPTVPQPTVTDFSGTPTEYVMFVSPVGFDNCAATDTAMVLPGFDYSVTDQQPSCLADDGLVIVEIMNHYNGPFTIELLDGGNLIESVQFDGNDYVNQTLGPGNYTINVFDEGGCLYSYDFTMGTYSCPLRVRCSHMPKRFNYS